MYLFLFDLAYLPFFFFSSHDTISEFQWVSFLVSFIVDIVAQDAFWLHGLFVL